MDVDGSEIWLTTWDVENLVNNGINYLSTGAGVLPSTIWFQIFQWVLEINVVCCCSLDFLLLHSCQLQIVSNSTPQQCDVLSPSTASYFCWSDKKGRSWSPFESQQHHRKRPLGLGRDVGWWKGWSWCFERLIRWCICCIPLNTDRSRHDQVYCCIAVHLRKLCSATLKALWAYVKCTSSASVTWSKCLESARAQSYILEHYPNCNLLKSELASALKVSTFRYHMFPIESLWFGVLL